MDTQRAGKTLFLGMSVIVFPEKTGLCIKGVSKICPQCGTIQLVEGLDRTKWQRKGEVSLSGAGTPSSVLGHQNSPASGLGLRHETGFPGSPTCQQPAVGLSPHDQVGLFP